LQQLNSLPISAAATPMHTFFPEELSPKHTAKQLRKTRTEIFYQICSG